MAVEKEVTAYGKLFKALCNAHAHRIAETAGFNKGQSFELWVIPGRKQPVLIQRYGEEGGGGWQDYHPGQIHETDPAIEAVLQRDPPEEGTAGKTAAERIWAYDQTRPLRQRAPFETELRSIIGQLVAEREQHAAIKAECERPVPKGC